jgi:hypothetical protein
MKMVVGIDGTMVSLVVCERWFSLIDSSDVRCRS